MADETELREYAASVAASTAEMVGVVDALKDALVAVLPSDEDCAMAIASARETRKVLIQDTYRIGLVPFMQQPVAEEEPREDDEGGGAAGSGSGEGMRGRR